MGELRNVLDTDEVGILWLISDCWIYNVVHELILFDFTSLSRINHKVYLRFYVSNKSNRLIKRFINRFVLNVKTIKKE